MLKKFRPTTRKSTKNGPYLLQLCEAKQQPSLDCKNLRSPLSSMSAPTVHGTGTAVHSEKHAAEVLLKTEGSKEQQAAFMGAEPKPRPDGPQSQLLNPPLSRSGDGVAKSPTSRNTHKTRKDNKFSSGTAATEDSEVPPRDDVCALEIFGEAKPQNLDWASRRISPLQVKAHAWFVYAPILQWITKALLARRLVRGVSDTCQPHPGRTSPLPDYCCQLLQRSPCSRLWWESLQWAEKAVAKEGLP